MKPQLVIFLLLAMLLYCGCIIPKSRNISGRAVHTQRFQCGQTRTVAGNGGAADSLFLGLGIEGSRKSMLILDSIRILNRNESNGNEQWDRIDYSIKTSSYHKRQTSLIRFAPGVGVDSCTLVLFGIFHCATGATEPYVDTLRIEAGYSNWPFPRSRR